MLLLYAFLMWKNRLKRKCKIEHKRKKNVKEWEMSELVSWETESN